MSMILNAARGLAVATVFALPAMGETMITKTSAHDVPTTIDRLSAAVEEAGARIFARVPHDKGAASVDMELRPTEALIFGNPALGTQALQEAQTIGLDLPLRVVAYEDAEGKTHVAYHNLSETLPRDHDIAADAEVLAKMSGALDKLTDKATAAE